MIKRIHISREDEAALAAADTAGFESSTTQPDYSTVVIEKPWGHEYSLIRSEVSDAWFLSIKYGERTSTHCHPTKKTSLVLLGGECIVTTFGEKTRLVVGEGLILDKGVFHSTEAVSPAGIFLLETETPVDKGDLIRLKDVYGRAGTSYESGKYVRPRDPSVMPSFYEGGTGVRQVRFPECQLTVHDIRDAAHLVSELPNFSGGILVVLHGEVRDGSGSVIVSHADAFHTHELDNHKDGLSLTGGLKILYVHKTL